MDTFAQKMIKKIVHGVRIQNPPNVKNEFEVSTLRFPSILSVFYTLSRFALHHGTPRCQPTSEKTPLNTKPPYIWNQSGANLGSVWRHYLLPTISQEGPSIYEVLIFVFVFVFVLVLLVLVVLVPSTLVSALVL